jgi:drug/metabolite transporter (DMT)-like permease
MPLALVEIWQRGLTWQTQVVIVQLYCVLAGGVVAFAVWSNALRYWPTSQVFLFNNLIPLSTMSWARVWLGEPVTATFWVAMLLIVTGVLVAQTNWERIFLQSRAKP